MEKKELLGLFKFYNEERKNPFIGKDLMKAKWWEGEKMFLEHIIGDPTFYARVEDELKAALTDGAVSDYIADNNNPMKKRTLVFYLDLWNGINHPNDSLDDIFDYIKAQ